MCSRWGYSLLFAGLTIAGGCENAGRPSSGQLALDSSALQFRSRTELKEWAAKSSFGGDQVIELVAAKRPVLVAIRCHTSGVESSEPFIYAEIDGLWRCLAHAATERCAAEAVVEDDVVVVRRVTRSVKGPEHSEWLRYRLPADKSLSPPR